MTTQIDTALELDDIQAAALMPRPNPYAGTYVAVRIDDRQAGRQLLRRLIPLLDPVATFDPGRPVSLGVGLSYSGLEALGVPNSPWPVSRPSSGRAWPPAPTTSETWARTHPSIGRRPWARRTYTWWWPRWPATPP